MAAKVRKNMYKTMPIGIRIGELCNAKGVTEQEIVSMSIGFTTKKEVKDLWKGKNEITPKQINAIAQLLGITYERLIQADTEDRIRRIEDIIANRHDLQEGLDLCDELLKIAIGTKEITDIHELKDTIKQIHTGSRIREGLAEFGFILQDIVDLGLEKIINISALQRRLDGKTKMYESHIVEIAKMLGMSYERLRQMDTEDDMRQLKEIVRSGKNLDDGIEIIGKLIEKAWGATEKCEIKLLEGKIFKMKDLDKEALEIWDEYKTVARKAKVDPSMLFRIYQEMVYTYIKLNDYDSAEKILQEAHKEMPQKDPESLGRLLQLKANYLQIHSRNRYAEADTLYENAKKLYRRIPSDLKQKRLLHRIEIDQADLEFRRGRFKQALEHLLIVRQDLFINDLWVQFILYKEQMKMYLCLERKEDAMTIFEEIKNNINTIDSEELQAKFLLLDWELFRNRDSLYRILQMTVSDQVSYAAAWELQKDNNNKSGSVENIWLNGVLSRHSPGSGMFYRQEWF